jgi:hypothetical protein
MFPDFHRIPKQDQYSRTEALFQSGVSGVDLELVKQVEWIAATVLVFTLSAVSAQQHYFPLHSCIQEGLMTVALIPLPILLIFEGMRLDGEILKEIDASQQLTS